MTMDLLDAVEVAQEEHKASKAGTDDATTGEMRWLIEGRVAALSEMQSMGGKLAFAPESHPEIAKALDEATTRYYPVVMDRDL